MKKEYKNPKIKVVQIEATLLNVASVVVDKNETPITDSDVFGARENSSFDEWDD